MLCSQARENFGGIDVQRLRSMYANDWLMTKIEVCLPYSKDRTENLILKKANMKDSQLSNNVVQSAYCLDAIGFSF